MAQMFILFEHASGYALFQVAEFEDAEAAISKIQNSVSDLSEFTNIVNLTAFQPFKTGRDALENMNSVSEGILHPHLQDFLESNLPKSKKKRAVTLGVQEPKLAAAISESLGINCTVSGIVPETVRGIRFYFHKLVKGFKDLNAATKTELGLGHHYSRARVKFNVNKIDNMIIQSISLLDQLDKDINTFSMRVREWYSHHFPELIQIVPENQLFIKCIRVIKDRKNMPEDAEQQLENILMDSTKAHNVIEVARSSMGMEISPLDMINITTFAERINSLMSRRKELAEYLKSKMQSIAPNLATLIGDTVGARLISRAGSLINLAKYPASTVQILGAEKALFRALKTHCNTPKYGLIYHSTFIARAGKNKGRISRFVANKLSVASRIDCFREVPTKVFGEKLKQQVEDRLKFYETGEKPAKNVDVMSTACEEAKEAEAVILKQIKKAKKKEKKRMSELLASSVLNSTDNDFSVVTNESLTEHTDAGDVDDGSAKKKKKKRKMDEDEQGSPKKMKLENQDVESEITDPEVLKQIRKQKKKEKKRLSQLSNSEFDSTGENFTFLSNESQNMSSNEPNEESVNEVSFKKKKKKKSQEIGEQDFNTTGNEFNSFNTSGDMEQNFTPGTPSKKKKKKAKLSQEMGDQDFNTTVNEFNSFNTSGDMEQNSTPISPSKKKKKAKLVA